jgi:hypothetical protein
MPPLLAVLILGIAPAAIKAETMEFRNDCRAPVVVHTSVVVGGKLFRNKPYLLKAGENTPKIKMAGDMVVTICDGRVPNRVLFQGGIRAGKAKLSYQIVPSRMINKVNVVRLKDPKEKE